MARNSPDSPIPRVALVTLGETPRQDMVDEILRFVDCPVALIEFGLLDGVAPPPVAPAPDEPALMTRLRNGRTAILPLDFAAARAAEVCPLVGRQDIDLVVVMTTILGEVPAPALARATIFCDRVIQRAIETFAGSGLDVGVIVSMPGQKALLPCWRNRTRRVVLAAAEPGNRAALKRALDRLAACHVLILHSVSHGEAERLQIAARTGKPVVHARRLVASAIRRHLMRQAAPVAAHADESRAQQLRSLSAREREVMFLVASGMTNKIIALRLGISHRTVAIHRSRMMAKMGFRNITETVRLVDRLTPA